MTLFCTIVPSLYIFLEVLYLLGNSVFAIRKYTLPNHHHHHCPHRCHHHWPLHHLHSSSLSYQTQTRRPKEVASGTDQVAKHKKHKSSQINLNYDAKGNLEFHLKRPNAPANLTSDLGETALLRWLFFISSFLRCTVLGYHASRHTRCHHCHYNH